MFKWLRKLVAKTVPHKPSELALEIVEALEHDEWEVDKYSMRHKASGMVLWMANRTDDHTFFHIHRLPDSMGVAGSKVPEDDLKKMLSKDDKKLVAAQAYKLYDQIAGTLNSTTLNALRLARQTTEI
jgi:hypothetical protein